MRKIKFLLVIVVLSLFSVRCTETGDSAATPTSLEISLKDNIGNVVQGASVKLYANLDDWNAQTNQVGTTQTSDGTGKVKFSNLSATNYYWLVQKDCSNNIFGASTTIDKLTANSNNTVTTILAGTGTLIFVNASINPYHVYVNGALAFDINGGTTKSYTYPVNTYLIRVLQINGYVLYPTDQSFTQTAISCGGTLTFTFPYK